MGLRPWFGSGCDVYDERAGDIDCICGRCGQAWVVMLDGGGCCS